MSDTEQPTLHLLDGHAAPPELRAGIAHVAKLPAGLHDNFQELLFPNLAALPEDQLDNRIARLCRRDDLPADVIVPAIKTVRFVFRSSAVHDLDATQLVEDLTSLGVDSAVLELLVPLYEKAKPDLRREIAQAAILAHGKVMAGIEWRMDTIGSSNAGRSINSPVALMTFRYQDGNDMGRVTMQLLPDMVEELHRVCALLLNK
jgi:hypothetical protein